MGRGCGEVQDSEQGRQGYSGQDTVQLVLGHPGLTWVSPQDLRTYKYQCNTQSFYL